MPKGYKPKGMDRVVLAIYEAFKRKRKPKKAKSLGTRREQVISDRLRDAGIDQKTINRWKGQKKSK